MSGMVHFREDDILDATKLFKVQWKEGVQIPGQISEFQMTFTLNYADSYLT